MHRLTMGNLHDLNLAVHTEHIIGSFPSRDSRGPGPIPGVHGGVPFIHEGEQRRHRTRGIEVVVQRFGQVALQLPRCLPEPR
jgi:hypothetical protein